MGTLTHTFFSIWGGFDQPSRRLLKPRLRRSVEIASSESTDTHREFIQEMLDRNPDAFSSEIDVQYLMSYFPGRP